MVLQGSSLVHKIAPAHWSHSTCVLLYLLKVLPLFHPFPPLSNFRKSVLFSLFSGLTVFPGISLFLRTHLALCLGSKGPEMGEAFGLDFWRALQLPYFFQSPPSNYCHTFTIFEEFCTGQGTLPHTLSKMYSLLV